MLSFLKTLDIKSLLLKKTEDTADDNTTEPNQDQTQDDNQKPYTNQPGLSPIVLQKKKQVVESTVMFAVLFGFSFFCFLFVIGKIEPKAATAMQINVKEARLDMAITKLTQAGADTFSEPERIAKIFYELDNIQQIKLNQLSKNPFKLESFNSDITVGGHVVTDAMQKIGLMEQANNMQLLSIIATNSGNSCMIDYKLLYKGDTIGGFEITEIADSYVKLELKTSSYADDSKIQPETMKIILRLSE
ncbi:MAG: hypothetical protein FVQ80_04185 [Planctomycetes bacterium]|nr:hypothetical protein [Planctomycetota bacterium]